MGSLAVLILFHRNIQGFQSKELMQDNFLLFLLLKCSLRTSGFRKRKGYLRTLDPQAIQL